MNPKTVSKSQSPSLQSVNGCQSGQVVCLTERSGSGMLSQSCHFNTLCCHSALPFICCSEDATGRINISSAETNAIYLSQPFCSTRWRGGGGTTRNISTKYKLISCVSKDLLVILRWHGIIREFKPYTKL